MDGDETKAACYAEFHLDYAIERIDLSDQKKIISTSNKFLVEKGLTFFFFKSATCNQTQIVAKANNYRILPWILK